jgi:flagellar hook-associated protein 3 FlgL
MRVSENQRYRVTANRVNAAKTDNTGILEKLSSQKDINRISDDPVGAIRMIKARNQIDNIGQYRKNIDFSLGFLERSESAVSGIVDNLMRAKELALAMANDTYDGQSRHAAGREVKEIIGEVIALGNTSYSGRYVFAGFRNQTPPVSEEGSYLGDDGLIYLPVDNGAFRQISLASRDLFEANDEQKAQGHFNLVHSLDMLYTGMTNDDKSMIQKALDELDFQQEKTTSFQATLGGVWKALEGASGRLELEQDQTKETLSKIEDADFYKTAQDFKQSETVLQATLMATNKVLQPSLLNFMQ